MIRVACLGPEGTVSHEALESAAAGPGVEVEPLFTPTIHHAVSAVSAGEADFALVPLENSLEGGVAATLDALLAGGGMTPIVGELLHPVEHRLVARPGTSAAMVEGIVSLPFVAEQCSVFLQERFPGVPVTGASSTADAVRTVAASDRPIAALGSELAARLYGCEVIADGLAEQANLTRFVWLAADRDGESPPGVVTGTPGLTSLVFWGSGADSPGWLVDCLAEFGSRGVNLTRIESRPRREGLGTYVFFADVEGFADDGKVAEAVAALRERADEVRLLGSYPAARSGD